MAIIEGVKGLLILEGAPSDGQDEVQTVTLDGSPTGGNYRLSFRDHVTAEIAHDASSGDVQSALEALGAVGSGNVGVSGSAGGPYTVTFQGTLAKLALPLLVLAYNNLEGDGDEDVTIAEDTTGQTASYRGSPKGTPLVDTTNGKLYYNAGTALEPVWNEVPEVGTAEIADDALSADTAGRKKIQDGYFDYDTVNAKFGASSIEQDKLVDLQMYEKGAPGRNTLRVANDVSEAETVTIGGDVFEVEIVNTDSSDTTADGDWNNTDDPLTVTVDGTTYPNLNGALAEGDLIRVENEIMAVTGVDGDDVTFKRGVSGTSAASHADAQAIYTGDGIAGGSTVAVGLVTTLTPDAFTDALVGDIAGGRGSEDVTALKISANEVLVYTADAPGGALSQTDYAPSCTETLAGANNEWAESNLVDGRYSGITQMSLIKHTVTATEVALTGVRILFPFDPDGFIAQLYDSDGLFKEDISDQITIVNNNRVEYDFTGATNPAENDVVQIMAWHWGTS